MENSSYPSVTGISLAELTLQLNPKDNALKWAMQHGLVASTMNCSCGRNMKIWKCDKANDGMKWRCTNNTGCSKTKSVRSGSFYEKCRLPLSTCITITYYWSMGDISPATVACMLQIDSSKTLPDWYNVHRDLCQGWYKSHPIKIGGPGRIVQIDETLVTSNKRTREGRRGPTQQRWVFGGIDNLTKAAFLVEVPQRDTATLMPIIQQHILPGTSVWSDRWTAYNYHTKVMGLTHGMDFMAPAGVHSNVVESLWRCFKEKFRRMHGACDIHLSMYLDEFIWQHSIRHQNERFQKALELIRSYYNV